ncbi:MAG: TVP38/TMEM64 family protein [Gammaproteobacteria bacterium]|nr:TVP38/TMEM64 family protein [Gammaproteobacteria bacterium]MCW5584418.1 TVP38/TMEM64 family protein [Gammaproteobacteria bacterium]
MIIKSNRILFWFILALLTVSFIIFTYLSLHDYLSLSVIKKYHFLLVDFKNRHYIFSIALYIFTYIFIVALAIPDLILITVLGGLIFGLIAILYTMFSLITGETILFYTVRNAFNLSLKNKTVKWKILFEQKFKENAFQHILLLKLIPIFPPFCLTDSLAALLNVRLPVFLAATFLGAIPTCFVYVLAGNSLSLLLENKELDIYKLIYRPIFFLPWLIIVFFLIFSYLYRRSKSEKY